MNLTSAMEDRIKAIIVSLLRATKFMEPPAAQQIIAEFGKDPFLILVSCILSLRTKDAVSLAASQRLFQYAHTPDALVKLSSAEIEKYIYPVGFFRKKAESLRAMSLLLIEKHAGSVPRSENELLLLPGVGRKTANLVLAEAFDIPAICVDTHVHRISNRIGLVKTNTPDETERELKNIIPLQYWIILNRLFVTWGQNICVPLSPFCSECAIRQWCNKIGVKTSR